MLREKLLKTSFQILPIMQKSAFINLFLFLFLISTYIASAEEIIPPKKFVVVLDAGHGGHDSGNRGSGYFEKDIALDIILKTGKILEKNPDIKVIYTRKTDVFIELSKRADIANSAKADLFVSVHCNAHNSNAYGTETFVLGLHANERNFNIAKKENSVILLEDDYQTNYDGYDPNSPESVIGLTLMQEEYLEQSLDLASHIQSNFTKQLKRFNRGVKQAGFLVLHRTFMPSVLIETGFLTNKNEGKYLNSDKGKQSMAFSISKAVLKYKGDVASMYEDTHEVISNTPVKQVVNEAIVPKIKEKETIEPVKQTINDSTTTTVVSETLVFKVQLLSGSSKIATTSDNFMGLSGVSIKEENGVFRYFYGSEPSYDAIKKSKQTAIDKGYKSCFVVAFKNGQRIPLSQAIK